MKAFLRLVVVALILTSAVLLWKKYRPAPPVVTPPPPVAEPAPVPPVEQPDLSSRLWTDQSGRTFEGSLVSAKNGQVIICRQSDSLYFQIPVGTLSAFDQTFVQEQSKRAEVGTGFVEQVPGHYTVSRKLDIKGYLVRVRATDAVGGWRHDRVDPMYLFLLSSKLHGADSGSLWVRVDEKTFRAYNEGGLISTAQLANFSDGKDGFSDALPWPRPQLTIIEAQYGPNAKGINVTHKLLRIAARGEFPVEIRPELFGLDPHAPASWELTVGWRTATGETRATLRDGSILTWP